jgi:glycosyltransferase involved in cell wall biosynthesis
VKILHVVTVVDDARSYGGPLTVAVNQCRELLRRGHDARILAGWRGSGLAPTELEGVPAHLFRVRRAVPGMRFSGLVSVPLFAWLRRNAATFDVAHLHLARDLVPLGAGVILDRARTPYVTQTHGMVVPDRRPHARAIDRLATLDVLRRARTRFVLTDAEEAGLDELLGRPGTTQRLANGVETPQVRRVPREPLDVLFMARLHPRKRVMDFAAAAETLIAEGHDATFSVVGPDDGDLPRLVQFMAARPQLRGRLRYEGALPHDKAMSRLAEAGIYVLPSIDEPFPMTLLEALSLGVPSVCTTSCGIASDLIADGAAVVTDPGPVALRLVLRRLLESSPDRDGLSESARLSVRSRYAADHVCARLLSSYQSESTTSLV